MTSRARQWLESDVLPDDVMEGPARKMITGEMELLYLIVKQIRDFNKPIIPVIGVVGFDEPGEGNIVRHLDAMGIMAAYSSPEQAIRALAKAEGYYRRRRAPTMPGISAPDAF